MTATGVAGPVTLTEADIQNLLADLAAKALDAAVLHLAGAETIIGPKAIGPYGDTATSRLRIYADEGQTANLAEFWSSAATGQNGQAQLTGYHNEKGEVRIIAAKSNSVPFRVKAQPGQTAHLLDFTDTNNTVLTYVDASGLMRSPNLANPYQFPTPGTLSAGAGKYPAVYNDTGSTLAIIAVRASVVTAPTGAAIIVDINKNGTTIFTTQANRPTIAIGTNTSGKVTSMDVTSLAPGDYLTVDIDQVGSGAAGSDLMVAVLAY